MKKVFCFVLVLSILFSLSACFGEKDYLKSTKGDLSVSLPEKQPEPDVNIESSGIYSDSLLVGTWVLKEVVDENKTISYKDSYYVFDATGRYKLVVGEESRSGRYTITDNLLTLSDTKLYFKVTSNRLELETGTGKVHHLTRAD